MSRIITTSELEHRTEGELCALFRKVSQEAAQQVPGSRARRNAIVSLDNISQAISKRRSVTIKPPRF